MIQPPSRTSRLARGALTLALPIVAVVLVLAVFELGLRLTGYQAIYEMYSKPSLFWRYDELLGWSHEPGAQGEFVGPRPWPIEFRGKVSINSIGLRGPEVPPRVDSERRVLFSGDSIVASFEVDYELTFVARLERMLRERLGTPVRTINAGVRGYGSDQDYLYFRERGWQLEPDLVVFFHSGNDPSDNTTLHEMRRPFGKPAFALTADGGLGLRGSPVPSYPSCSEVSMLPDFAVQRVDNWVGRSLCGLQMALFDHSALFSYITLAVPWDKELLRRLYYVGNPHIEQLARANRRHGFANRLTAAILLAFAHEVHRRGAGFMVVGLSHQLNQIDFSALVAEGVRIVPLTPIEGALRELRWQHDGHFNPTGHERVADLLAPEIEAELTRIGEQSPSPAAASR